MTGNPANRLHCHSATTPTRGNARPLQGTLSLPVSPERVPEESQRFCAVTIRATPGLRSGESSTFSPERVQDGPGQVDQRHAYAETRADEQHAQDHALAASACSIARAATGTASM